MTDKEFRHLRRADLIDIIYELQSNEVQLQEEIKELKTQLADKRLKIAKVGSIAEAAVSLNGFFESAQATANQYLQEIHHAKVLADKKVKQAEEKAAAIVAEAKEESEKILAAAGNIQEISVSETEKPSSAGIEQPEVQCNEQI